MTTGHLAILDGVRERFDSSTDFTVGIEEEYQLVDPESLALRNRFEDVVAAAPPDLAPRLAGELIASELEFKTRAHATFPDAARELAQGRLACAELVERLGLVLGVAGVHPFSPWQEQRIIDTPHYRLVEGELGYIAWTNNTWAIHLHCGVRGADRAVAVSTAMRSLLPELLALSANSAVFLGRVTRLHSTRTQTFIRSFPRCGIPDAYGDWDEYARHVRLLEATGSIVESTQIWWSVRPHHAFGTIEVRICDGQTELGEALAVAALALACIARLCADHDAGRRLPAHPRALIEENLWRAQRHGLEGSLIDLDAGRTRSAADALRHLLDWTAHQQSELGLEPFTARVETMLREGNGAMRQIAHMAETEGDVLALQAGIVARTRRSAEEVLHTLDAGVAR
ncbi:MAG TPA: YbdK family carboxylate-amine ligase [Miltoncostaeaceae bacterium]|nr:YbdK family carboxylate-amine ligase [Miltoncostaeaceae bacterium]